MDETRKVSFSKYQTHGHHLIVVDNRCGLYNFNNPELVKDICSLRTGIGGDCLLELKNCCNHETCSYELVTWLPNGNLGQFCGNGSRCMAAFAHRLGVVSSEKFTFWGFDGEHWGRHHSEEGVVEISIRDVNEITAYDETSYYLHTGCPIHVECVKSLKDYDVKRRGDEIRFDRQRYPEGVNVMLFEDEGEGEITMRSYERGINNETWACGTGTAAVALVARARSAPFRKPETSTTAVKVRLGRLFVTATRIGETHFTNISLIGPTRHVFDGDFIWAGQQRNNAVKSG